MDLGRPPNTLTSYTNARRKTHTQNRSPCFFDTVNSLQNMCIKGEEKTMNTSPMICLQPPALHYLKQIWACITVSFSLHWFAEFTTRILVKPIILPTSWFQNNLNVKHPSQFVPMLLPSPAGCLVTALFSRRHGKSFKLLAMFFWACYKR